VELLADGSVTEYERHDRHDANLNALSPNGRFVVYTRDNPETPEYDPQLRIAWRDGSGARTVAGHLSIWTARLSRDGMLVAGATRGVMDSLVVLDLRGNVHRIHEWHRINLLDWCGDDGSIVAIAEEEGLFRLVRIDPQGVPSRVNVEVVQGPLACSPDGTAAVVNAIVDGAVTASVVDLRTGASTPLPRTLLRQPSTWLSDPVPAMPVHLNLPAQRQVLSIGQHVRVDASVTLTDGTRRQASPEWTSSAADVASVIPGGGVVGNRPGVTVLHAEFPGLPPDSIMLEVRGETESALLLAEPFDTLDEHLWQVVGVPVPAIARVAGSNVLELRGDGNLLDGIVLRRRLTSAQGLTVEFEVLLPLTSAKWQRLNASLCGRQPVDVGASRGNDTNCENGHLIAFLYPAEELAKFDPTSAAFAFREDVRHLSVDPRQVGERWLPVALQVQPDGYAALALNYGRVATSRVRKPNATELEWELRFFGSAVGTRLYIRNLRVWQGLRY
jgi:hypothetical protein